MNGPSSPGEDPSEVLGACAQVKPEMIDIYFPQDELEKANKDKKHFPAGFKVNNMYILVAQLLIMQI